MLLTVGKLFMYVKLGVTSITSDCIRTLLTLFLTTVKLDFKDM